MKFIVGIAAALLVTLSLAAGMEEETPCGDRFCNERQECFFDDDGNESCMCKEGFTGYLCLFTPCPGISPCNLREDCTATDLLGVNVCACKEGYKGAGCHDDVDECQELDPPPCSFAGGYCENRWSFDGFYDCGCDTNAGWTDGDTPVDSAGRVTSCQDIDECSQDPSPCHPNATCKNEIPGFTCTCNGDLVGDAIESCELPPPQEVINPCDTKNCDPSNSFCELNDAGVAQCLCKSGFSQLRPDFECTDDKECDDATSCPDPNSFCQEQEGGYECLCKDGYEGGGDNCSDIDECEVGSPCPDDKLCVNTEGEFECIEFPSSSPTMAPTTSAPTNTPPPPPPPGPSPTTPPNEETGISISSGGTEDLAVTECEIGFLKLSGNLIGQVIDGLIIWTLPPVEGDDSTDICADCSSLVRRVISTGPFDSSETTLTCLPSETDCVVVQTEAVTVSEFFEEELIDGLQLEGMEDVAVETAFGCTDSTMRRKTKEESVSSTFYTESDHFSRLLQDQCSDYLAIGSDGRCVFTDCFVGTDGNPADCFFCGANCDNGCGADGGTINPPDSIPLVFDFGPACCSHDHCYTSASSRSACDSRFRNDMLRSCSDSTVEVGVTAFILPLAIFRSSVPGVIIALRCELSALGYYSAVALGGGPAYAAAQASRLNYEESPACAAQCPTQQSSGGKGGTTLTVDLMSNTGDFDLFYEFYRIPDQITVTYEGNVIFSTDGLVSGSRNISIDLPSGGTSTLVQVEVFAPIDDTAWVVSVGCAL